MPYSDMTLDQFRSYMDGGEWKYTSIGCYPLFYLCADGGILCPDCARKERAEVEAAIEAGPRTGNDGWRVVAVDANWEDPAMYCDHCGGRVESAYAEDEAEAVTA